MARIIGRQGQVTVEVAVLFAFVIAGIVALALYLQRGAQGGMKSSADSLGQQFSSNAKWNSHTKSNSLENKTVSISSQSSGSCQGIGGVANPGCTVTSPPLP